MKKHLFIPLFLFLLAQTSLKGAIEDTDYLQILIYGQSLGMGWEAPMAITTEPLEGNYMVGNNVLMKYNNNSTTLSPLVATQWANGGEQPIVSCVNSFSKRYRENVKASQKFIAMTGGEGGQTIETLSKECTNHGYGGSLYSQTFIKTLNNTSTSIGEDKTVSCPAIIYMQGEFNCNQKDFYQNKGLTKGTDGTTDKDTYKALLLKLKNNMQADVMEKYGQKEKPLFFIYQTSGGYLRKKEMSIAMAQFEFAMENDDVVMLNPHYGMSDYGGGHLSTNGYRWFGEVTGNILYDVLVDKKQYKPVYPINFSKTDKTITIDFHVPAPPLQFDTWTTPKVLNYGFMAYNNGSSVIIRNIEVKDTQVVITTSTTLSDNLEVIYAGNFLSGTGNLCDSYTTHSMYTYFDDSSNSKKESYTPKTKNGESIYGKEYPMQNWSVGFYHNFASSSGISADESDLIELSVDENNKEIYFDNSIPASSASLDVYSLSGLNVLNYTIPSNEKGQKISIGNLPSGMYVCTIRSNDSIIVTKKFILR